jgi:hypothetical protein
MDDLGAQIFPAASHSIDWSYDLHSELAITPSRLTVTLSSTFEPEPIVHAFERRHVDHLLLARWHLWFVPVSIRRWLYFVDHHGYRLPLRVKPNDMAGAIAALRRSGWQVSG